MPGHRSRTLGLIFSTLILILSIGAYFVYRHYGDLPKDAFISSGEAASGSSVTTIRPGLLSDENLKKLLDEVDSNGLSKATVVITTARGKIKFKFYSHDAPRTTARISELIQQGFYNGLIFHRVEPQFVIQGGDPTGLGSGGSGTKIPAEFNSRKHVQGTIAMARSQNDINSADSQFYISLGTHSFLDQHYTVFGQLIEGQDVANQIQAGDRMTSVSIEAN